MRITFAAIVLAIASLTTGCDDADSPAGPSSFQNELDFVPLALPRLTWSSPHPCSSVVTPLILNVTAGTAPITLSEVLFRSMDLLRSTAPPTIFDAASLTRQFGSTTVEGFGVRQFPFTYPFGCVVGGTVLHTSVTTIDSGSVSRVQTMQVPVH
jgi:hypothetical protein